MNGTNINVYQMNLLIVLIDKNNVQLNSALWVRRELKISSGKKSILYAIPIFQITSGERRVFLCLDFR